MKDEVWEEWKLYTPEHPGQDQKPSSYCLWLVRQRQPAGPYHWLLAIATGDGGYGDVYQVKGDAGHMHHAHLQVKNVFTSDSYFDSYILGHLDNGGSELVRQCAQNQPPPAARNVAEITENCQGWVIRVLKDLQARKVVDQAAVDKCQAMMEPLF
ncbi:hypothetical protein SAMD00023353_0700620 [Rosellinia necatrix]|uniref:Uncharacterized protein n=1 Tax=Rosellinia necatrix TaxID=77044 RepID=A0A1S7ULQ3_ROSNE|nr:hypothetical protein SAMD00023353_0700620 [Rosellinia necatrix]